MARYIPISRRRRNAAIATVIALFVGIALGWLIGKQSAPSVSSAVKDAQQRAADIAIQLERLPIEYSQALTGSGDTVQAGVIAPLDDIQAAATNAFDDTPWVSRTNPGGSAGRARRGAPRRGGRGVSRRVRGCRHQRCRHDPRRVRLVGEPLVVTAAT